MEDLIRKYIDEQQQRWSESTRRSEYFRLCSVADKMDGVPATLWRWLEQNISPYSRCTYWTRVIGFWDWLKREGNPYREFRKTNARLFKHTYQPRLPEIGFEEARRRIETLEAGPERENLLAILTGGLRISELDSYDPRTGTVLGKGGKRRRVYCTPFSRLVGQATLRRRLALLGLKPHDLRKVRATELRRKGLRDEDLLKIFGWESMETARRYLSPLQDEEIAKVMNG